MRVYLTHIYLNLVVWKCGNMQIISKRDCHSIVKKRPSRLRLIDVFFQSYDLFKFEHVIFFSDLCTLNHSSKRNILKVKNWALQIFSFNYSNLILCQFSRESV